VPVSVSPTLSVSTSGGNILLSFPTDSGKNYTILTNDTVVGGNWQPLGAPIAGDGSVKTVTNAVAGTKLFYRLQIQ
jgi:hypothetical protein